MSELVLFALRAFAPLAGLATMVCALELLRVRRALAGDGVFAWPVLRRDLAPGFGRSVADTLFSYRGVCTLLVVQALAGLVLVASAIVPSMITESAVPAWLAAATTLAIAVRFRGTYNGGSDAMLLVVLLTLALVRTAPGTVVAEAALAYAAAQLVLSYFVAGVAKLRDPVWRRLRALPVLVTLPQYRVPSRMARRLSPPVIARAATFAMLAFELLSPLALLDATACVVMLGIGVVFHLANAFVFGLDRFLWTWLAAYPALLYWTAFR